MCISDFYIIAEHIVISYLKARNTCGLHLAALHFQQIVFPLESHLAQFIKLLVNTGLDHIPTVELVGSVLNYLPGNAVAHHRARVNLLAYRPERL